MFDDLEIPDFLRRSSEEAPSPTWRRLWPETTQENMQILCKGDEAIVAAFKAEQAETARIKTKNRIAKMLARKQNHEGERWNTKTAKWEPRS